MNLKSMVPRMLIPLSLLLAVSLLACAAPTSAPTVAESPTPTASPSLKTKPSRPPLKIGETIYSHDFSFTPVEIGYTELLINGPFRGNTFGAFKPIEGYKFVYLRMVVQNEGVERAAPPLLTRGGEFKVEVDKGYIYNQITGVHMADKERLVGSADQEQRRAYPSSNYLVFDFNPEEQEEMVVALEILENTVPIEVSFRLFDSPEFASEYGLETIIIPIETLTAVTPTPTPTPTPAPFPIPSQKELRIHFIDVGQGDAILIDLGESEVLIDGGGKSSGVVTYLNEFVDGALEVMVVTHPHADHIGGLIAILDAFELEEIWLTGDTTTSETFQEFMSRVNAEDALLKAAMRGQSIEVDGLTLSILHPMEDHNQGETNNNSIVLSLSYGEIDFLFTGDAEKEAEESMLGAQIVPEVEILKVGHHGSNTSSRPSFINTTKPEVAIYTAGSDNSYGLPHQETLITLDSIGAEIYGTDVHGTIIITTNGQTYDLRLERQAPPIKPATATPSPTPTPSIAADIPATVSVEKLADGSYLCRPAGAGAFPAVLYNHGGLGTVVGGDMLGTCRALAEAGYLARSEKRPETRHLTGHLDQVLAGLSQLRSHADADPNRVGLIGFSRGGLLTLQAAIEQPQSMHAVVLMAPARGKNVMEQTLQHVSSIAAPVRVFVSENDLYQTNHVEIAHDVEDALSAAGKEVVLTIYPPYEDDGHKLFFVLQEPYWNDLMAFLDQTIGRPSRGE